MRIGCDREYVIGRWIWESGRNYCVMKTAKGAKIFSAAVAATIDSQQIGKDGEEKLKMHTHSYCCLDYVQLKPVSVVIDFTDPSMVYDNVKQHNEDSVSFDCNGAFGHEDPNSQASLEDLCRSHLVSPDLYGDNNTRLVTYWTVSLYFFHFFKKSFIALYYDSFFIYK
ncbi:uncharacterized protein LOC131248683 isoform X6 [Magnolia sinica]|uniref:uncharacterized protein LOC131248683 isoform X6 n=1 Tax=Magnolia sinica TaxID=86752 RepID=UPI0026589119|nr:uncharacterized protein LOC131248683 isoform X6 [Magnolia sinica]